MIKTRGVEDPCSCATPKPAWYGFPKEKKTKKLRKKREENCSLSHDYESKFCVWYHKSCETFSSEIISVFYCCDLQHRRQMVQKTKDMLWHDKNSLLDSWTYFTRKILTLTNIQQSPIIHQPGDLCMQLRSPHLSVYLHILDDGLI